MGTDSGSLRDDPSLTHLALIFALICAAVVYFVRRAGGRPTDGGAEVGVLVVGDLGRSPRSQFQALSLANAPGIGRVHVMGDAGTPLYVALRSHPRVQLAA